MGLKTESMLKAESTCEVGLFDVIRTGTKLKVGPLYYEEPSRDSPSSALKDRGIHHRNQEHRAMSTVVFSV